jgi:hypothetical protein
MFHEEVEIPVKNYIIKASIKIPTNSNSKNAVVLAHGGLINRKSLVRTKHSLGEYLCDILDAYIIAPDFLGETVHKKSISFDNYSEILNISTKYIVEQYNIDEVMGFGHSMGCYIMVNALQNNSLIGSIVNYGGPIKELENKRQKNFLQYLINYLTRYDYGINIRNLVPYIFDEETSRYLIEVMLKDEDYGFENYNFKFESNIFRDLINIIEEYIELIKNWGKPALLLFGSKDNLTKKTCSFYEDNSVDDNIKIKYVQGASHITPCMKTVFELSKLSSAISFYAKNHNIDIEKKPKISPLKFTTI